MSKSIYFIEKSYPFNAHDLSSSFIGGSEKTLINISLELAKIKDFKIKVFNLTKKNEIINNVEWVNINNIPLNCNPDFLVAMSDANLLSLINCKKNFLWSHSIQSFEKFIRKNQFYSFIKNKPIMILEGEYHFNKRSILTSFFGKKILPISVDYDFIETYIDENLVPSKRAIFNTRSDRNIKFLIDCWKTIKFYTGDSNLYINPPFNIDNTHIKLGIKLRTKGPKIDLINDLVNSRVMLNPGHKGEVFCLAAEEAKKLCVPIVTMGYGSLYERVEHGITGFIAKNKNEFIDYSINLLNNDSLYLDLKKNLFLKRNSRNYSNVANDLVRILFES